MKIALISDIHFGLQSTTDDLVVPQQKSKDPQLMDSAPFFDGVIEILKNEHPHPNYLFIAGDLTSTASPLEYKYCYEKLLRFESEAGIVHNNWIACLGNHDVDRKISELGKLDGEYAAADKEYIDRHYMDARNSDLSTHQIIQDLSNNFTLAYPKIPMTGVVERDDCIVFVLNSGYLCTADKSGGKLASDQLRWFKDTAEKYKEENKKPKIALLHHHPYYHKYPVPVRDLSVLEEGAELHSYFGELGINLVIHGHCHHPAAKTVGESGDWVNAVTYICSGSLSVCEKDRAEGHIRNAFHIINYNNAENIILETYTYDSWNGGWQKRGDRDIDGEIHLGRIIFETELKQHIRELPLYKAISYSSLPDELKYCSLKKLNKLVHEIHEPLKRQVQGDFPKDISILGPELLEVIHDGNEEIQRTAITI